MAGHNLMNSKLVRLGSSTSALAIDILWLCHALQLAFRMELLPSF